MTICRFSVSTCTSGEAMLRRRHLGEQVVRNRSAPTSPSGPDTIELIGRHLGGLGEKVRVSYLQASGSVHAPGAEDVIGIREPDVAPLVVGKIEVVVAQPVLNPVRDADERGALDVLTDTRVQVGPDDRPVQQSLDAHMCGRCPAGAQHAQQQDDDSELPRFPHSTLTLALRRD